MARDIGSRESRRDRRARKRREKQPLGERIGKQLGDKARALGDQVRSAGELGDAIVNRPGTLPGRAHGWFRRWFAKVWRVRGGGLYAFGFAVSFVIYEVQMIAEDFSADSDYIALFDGKIIEFIVNFFLESLMNTVHALMWPVPVVQMAPPYGAIGLGLAFVFFARVLKGPIEKWLFADQAETDPDGESRDKNTDKP